jgi:hypothetical protein
MTTLENCDKSIMVCGTSANQVTRRKSSDQKFSYKITRISTGLKLFFFQEGILEGAPAFA